MLQALEHGICFEASWAGEAQALCMSCKQQQQTGGVMVGAAARLTCRSLMSCFHTDLGSGASNEDSMLS
jgi:hypothetical protein